MAADSTFNETESSPEEAQSDPPSLLGPSPPRPPRPAKRPIGIARVPMPSPADRFEQSDLGAQGDVVDASVAPSLDDADGKEPEFPLVASRAKLASEPPEESFADIEADLEDRAPSAPITPWRHVPPLVDKPPAPTSSPAVTSTRRGASPTPASATRREAGASPAVAIGDEHGDHEDTLVGEVPKDLLELSSSGDENTRAYTAPQELIELAKRKREQRLKAKAAVETPEAHSRETARPPHRGAGPAARGSVEDVPRAARLPVFMVTPLPEGDSAPAVDREVSDRAPPPSIPVPRSSAADSAPVVEVGLGSELPEPGSAHRREASPRTPRSDPTPVASLGIYERSRSWDKGWLLVVAMFIILGVVISRWRGIEQFLFR